MQKIVLFALASLCASTVGCAADDPRTAPEATLEPAPLAAPAASAADATLGVTFVGLTVLDCQAEATKCVGSGGARSDCAAQLDHCLADIRLQTSDEVRAKAGATLSCGDKGRSCFSDPSGALHCQQEVERCVVKEVDGATKLGIPAVARLLGVALDVVGETVGAVVDIAKPVLTTGGKAVGRTLDAAGDVIGSTAEVAEEVVGGTLDLAAGVIERTADVAGGLVGTATDLVGHTVGGAVEVTAGVLDLGGLAVGEALDVVGGLAGATRCALATQRCWRESRDGKSCRHEYEECIDEL